MELLLLPPILLQTAVQLVSLASHLNLSIEQNFRSAETVSVGNAGRCLEEPCTCWP